MALTEDSALYRMSIPELEEFYESFMRKEELSEAAIACIKQKIREQRPRCQTVQQVDELTTNLFSWAWNYDAPLGKNPERQAQVWVSDADRQSGMYIVGEQGTGKSSLLEKLIIRDIYYGFPVIVIDPHGDLILHVIGHLPESKLKNTYLLNMEDESHPFGVNSLAGTKYQTSIAQTQAVDRVMHMFAVLWGEMLLTQRDLPRYLRLATLVLLVNPGTTLVDMYYFLRDDHDQLRQKLLKNVTDPDIRQFWEQYASKSPSVRRRELEPLLYRLEALFLGRSLVKNIVGQSATTIDFRRAIENKEIILIRLPLKTLPQDAALVGTMLVAQIREAIFSFADTPQERRPSYSIFIDEFQNFISTDIKEIFAEGRKFGSRLCVAHQRPDQLPEDLFAAALSAKTKLCFRVTKAAREMAPIFMQQATKVRKEDIDPHPVSHLLTYPHKNETVARFVDLYLRSVSMLPKRFEVSNWEASYGASQMATDFALNIIGYMTNWPPDRPKVDNPLPYLDPFLYKVQVEQNPSLPIPLEVVIGFSDSGVGYYKLLDEKIRSEVLFALLEVNDPARYRGKLPGKREQADPLIDLLINLRAVMAVLAADPIGETRAETKAEVEQRIIHLPNREALVSVGERVSHVRTHDTYKPKSYEELKERALIIIDNSYQKYCRPKDEVERKIQARLGAKANEKADTIAAVGSLAVPEPEPAAPQKPEKQTAQSIPASMDTMNVLSIQMRAREIDPDTTILAALGEHYVLTIKQWMRLFSWGSYPRATQYFKELKDNDLIYRKNREGRGGTLVEGDWFFLLTKGANELLRRRQDNPLFRLEPNEAERASGDTLVHTYLVNEILIHLRLLEREHPDKIKIEQINHERSMRRVYLEALSDTKLYPDGFLRLLIPTLNGLKRRHTFIELQHTTQRDGANWKTKCRKYLALFEQASLLEHFFSTRTPQVLVITMDAQYAAYHKQWTEEVLVEQGAKGQAFSNRFLIGSYDTGISDMNVTPEQFFCTPRFYIPFEDVPCAGIGT